MFCVIIFIIFDLKKLRWSLLSDDLLVGADIDNTLKDCAMISCLLTDYSSKNDVALFIFSYILSIISFKFISSFDSKSYICFC